MSSVSAILGVKIFPNTNTKPATTTASVTSLRQSSVTPPTVRYGAGDGAGIGLMIECSSRPQKKATAHHRKTRPKKTQPWDKNRGPAVYPPLPPLPQEWSFTSVNNNNDLLLEPTE